MLRRCLGSDLRTAPGTGCRDCSLNPVHDPSPRTLGHWTRGAADREEVMMTHEADAYIETKRDVIDDIDAQLIKLIRIRVHTSRAIQRARIAAGGPRVEEAREREVLARWHAALGQAGVAVAGYLLELGRGRA